MRPISLPDELAAHDDSDFLAPTSCPAHHRNVAMTEAQWLACTDPTPMLAFVGGRVSRRKLWLFGCACCRRIRPLPPQASREAGESYADGLAPHAELMATSVRNYREAAASGAEMAVEAAVAANMAVAGPSWNGCPAFSVA